MLEGTDIEIAAQLPDENEYPAPLLARCELLECFSERDDTRTLLAKDRESDRLYVVKCHLASGPFYDRTDPDDAERSGGYGTADRWDPDAEVLFEGSGKNPGIHGHPKRAGSRRDHVMWTAGREDMGSM